MINIKQIEAFYWTQKLGTLQRAATRLFITQSAATKRLQELEKQASLPLFEASGPKAHLSAKGAELMGACEGLIDSLEKLEALRGASRKVQRTVRIGVTELVALTWFSRFVARAKVVHPDLSLHPEVDVSACLQQKLLEGELDLIVIPEDYVTSAMAAIALQSVEFTWLAPANSFAPGRVLSLEELAKWPVVVQGAQSGITQRCERLFAQAGVEFSRVYGSNSLFALVALIRAGVGISCLPKALFAEDVQRGELQAVNVDVPPAPVNYQLAFLKHEHNGLTTLLAGLASECAQG